MNRHYVKGNTSDRGAKSGLTVEVRNGNLERAIRKFKKKVTEAGIIQEVRERREFVKPSEKKRKAKDAGRKRWLRKQKMSEWNN